MIGPSKAVGQSHEKGGKPMPHRVIFDSKDGKTRTEVNPIQHAPTPKVGDEVTVEIESRTYRGRVTKVQKSKAKPPGSAVQSVDHVYAAGNWLPENPT
jgi:hypothetical protein